ncbi:hypothetical protein ACFV1N_39105 [Streptosporangium canum]|uniref:hypothetical protein n=1 Tax=Streptosporangium canum TaxID=324952 RepID=UPI00367C1DA0
MPLMSGYDLVDEASFWPGPVDTSDLGLHGADGPPIECAAQLGEGWTDRPWRLDLCRDGTLSICTQDKEPFNGGARPVAYAYDKTDLKRIQALTCALWPERDKRLTHEGGRRYIFDWMTLPGTRWQLSAAMRVLDILGDGGDIHAAFPRPGGSPRSSPTPPSGCGWGRDKADRSHRMHAAGRGRLGGYAQQDACGRRTARTACTRPRRLGGRRDLERQPVLGTLSEVIT